MNKFHTLRFSGCGHLLPYHLGVSSVLIEESKRTVGKSDTKKTLHKIKSVGGSSAGAIAAVLHARLPNRIEEFAMKFISDRGHAFETLKAMLYEEENSENLKTTYREPLAVVSDGKGVKPPRLHIATTRCEDGSNYVFNFSGCFDQYSSISTSWTTDKVLDAVKASCKIPQSFHPVDIISTSQSACTPYPDSDGILIDGSYHVDGGIAAPGGPTTPLDRKEEAYPIVISPISVGNSLFSIDSKQTEISKSLRISPTDNSWRLLPISNIRCRGDFKVKPSVQNLKAMRMASGLVSSTELENWYKQGIDDALEMMKVLKNI